MPLLGRSLLRFYHPLVSKSALPSLLHTSSIRSLSTDDRFKRWRRPASQEFEEKAQDADHLLHPDNVKDLTQNEIARLRVVYGLVKEHVEAAKQNLDSVDVEQNPLLDPRSFEVNKLPELPPTLLQQFRKDLPGDLAAFSRPVSTHGIWDSLKADQRNEETESVLQNENAAEWAAVDERTMEGRQYSRMQRQSFAKSTDLPPKARAVDHMQNRKKKKKKKCPLSGADGRVHVDFRAVATVTSFMSDNGKILPRRKSGLSCKAQRKLSKAAKTARQMALIHPEPDPMPTVEELLEIERSLP